MKAFGTGLLVLFASPGAAQGAQPQPPAVAVAEAAPALELAKLVSPAEALLDQEIATARAGFFDAIGSDPDFKALEKEFPGIGQAVWDALEPEARRVGVESAPRLWEELAKVYSSRLTPTETRALIAFYQSPTGQKAIRTMYASVDMAPMFKEVLNSTDGKISAGSLATGQRSAKVKTVEAMGPEDQAALIALSRAIPMGKLQSVGREVQKVTLEFLNEEDPESDARIEALVSETVDRYMTKNAKRSD